MEFEGFEKGVKHANSFFNENKNKQKSKRGKKKNFFKGRKRQKK